MRYFIVFYTYGGGAGVIPLAQNEYPNRQQLEQDGKQIAGISELTEQDFKTFTFTKSTDET